MNMKILLSLCLIVICTSVGYSMAQTAERRCRQLAETIRAIRVLGIQITVRLEPIKRALLQTEFEAFRMVAEGMTPERSACDVWNDICSQREEHSINGLDASEKRRIGQMFSQLGDGSKTMQEELLTSCRIDLQNALSDAQVRAKEVSKLYTSLGFLMGISIVILII